MILGCILAGGQSTRFGSDKALAEFDGQTLLARAFDMLSSWCEHVVVAGRTEAPTLPLPATFLRDRPRAGMGPLGGLAAALHFARDEGYGWVLSCGVDAAGLPDDLPTLLAPGPSYVAAQPVIGLWPAAASPALNALLESEARHSMRGFAERIDAKPVRLAREPDNINTPADLAGLEHRHGL